MKLPPELTEARPQREAAAAPAAPTGSGAASDRAKAPRGFREVWYGFYPNGREVLFGVETVHGSDLSAVYAVGPSIDDAYPAAWSRRKGHIVDDSFVFEEKGKSTLRFRPRQDGGLAATWIAADGKTSIDRASEADRPAGPGRAARGGGRQRDRISPSNARCCPPRR